MISFIQLFQERNPYVEVIFLRRVISKPWPLIKGFVIKKDVYIGILILKFPELKTGTNRELSSIRS